MKYFKLLIVFMFSITSLMGQQTAIEPGQFDQGKMWTFENLPLDYFEETYGFRPTQEWIDDVRMSALRFSSWCSASFISEEGLIMTNHHCSRGVVASVMKEGENFDKNGFYAETAADERRVPDLYVEQLYMIADITEMMKKRTDMSEAEALEDIKKEYAAKPEWAGLNLETKSFYSGNIYSLYGFKKFDDIRLVLYPELGLGYFGGDPDNFTYPRYNLDFTFFRAYDENGKPLNPEHYFEYNKAGAVEDEAVFIIGNPGSTGRYQTMSQLYYQRDVSAPVIVSLLKNRKEILLMAAENITDVYEKDSVVNEAFGLSNSEKAYTGRLKGLNDEYLMTKKQLKEEMIRKNVKLENDDPWNKLEKNSQVLAGIYADLVFISPSGIKGKVNQLLHPLYDYQQALAAKNDEAVAKAEEAVRHQLDDFDMNLEKLLFAVMMEELNSFSKQSYVKDLIGTESPRKFAEKAMMESKLFNNTDAFFKMKAKKLDSDPMVEIAASLIPAFRQAAGVMGRVSNENKQLEKEIASLSFQVSGLNSPPDATFSLRFADGVVKGYEYNGTTAPWKTTYFGLYDRHFSHEQEYPWDLPEKWQNPPMDLLKSPMNFVCTADIIGGNSGSPVINKKGEVVGLVFDGNIESLPGYFIFDTTYNRTVSVHSGGIFAALKYIYKAERLVKELE